MKTYDHDIKSRKTLFHAYLMGHISGIIRVKGLGQSPPIMKSIS
jgi:hypothetical protein